MSQTCQHRRAAAGTLSSVDTEFEHRYAAIASRDARFDGQFYYGVSSTGIYCRPSCPATTPKRANVSIHASAAAAQHAGFRACKRCRPDAVPGSPEWNVRRDVVARAMRMIGDGVIEREGVAGLARRVGYSTRQLERHVVRELGAGPLAIARSQRARTARILIETTRLPMTQVAAAAGFASLRSFNHAVRDTFGEPPTMLRARTSARAGSHSRGAVNAALELRLAYREPLQPDNLFGHLAATAVPGVEEWRDGWYRRTLRLTHGNAIVALRPAAGHIACRLWLDDLRDMSVAVARCRWLLDLDADPVAIDRHLAADALLAPMVAAAPGRRVPRTVAPEEFAIRAVLGQQVSTRAAQTHAARLVTALGDPIDDPDGGLTHVFPSSTAIAQFDPARLALPTRRASAVVAMAAALATGAVDLGPGADIDAARAELHALAGIGPWTVETIAMRSLGDPDAFVASDLGILAAARDLGIATSARELDERSRDWRPWRAYAVQHLWATQPHAINRLPD
jgi:AraC family transcriptional regulator of adaptative response / DNA-3-methyladenine glycosylase II